MGYLASLAAEKRVYEPDGERFKWVRLRRRNDYLDCRSYGVAGAMYLAKKIDLEQEAHQKAQEQNAHRVKAPVRPTRLDFINSRGRYFE